MVRIPYVWFEDTETNDEVAVAMLMGDKTVLGRHWYETKVKEIESRMIPEWERRNATHKARIGRIG